MLWLNGWVQCCGAGGPGFAPWLQTSSQPRRQASARGEPAAYVSASHADYMARFYQASDGREGGRGGGGQMCAGRGARAFGWVGVCVGGASAGWGVGRRHGVQVQLAGQREARRQEPAGMCSSTKTTTDLLTWWCTAILGA